MTMTTMRRIRRLQGNGLGLRNQHGAKMQQTCRRKVSQRTGVYDEGLVLREVLADCAHHDHGDNAGHDDHDHARVQDAEPVHLRLAGQMASDS